MIFLRKACSNLCFGQLYRKDKYKNLKMKHFIFTVILLMAFCSTGTLFGQGVYDEAVYRGPVALSYPFKTYKGTYYAFDKLFEKGDVEYNRKWYRNVELNLDACRDELCLSMGGRSIIVLSKELVGRFVFSGRNFICLGDSVEGLAPGYYQVLYDGEDKVYKKIIKKYDKTDGITQEFYPIVKYYLVQGNKARQIKGTGIFGKVYKPLKKEIRRLVSSIDRTGISEESLYVAIMEMVAKKK